MRKQVEACCTSPAAMCYWLVVSLVAWGVLSFIGIYWRPLHASSAAGCLFAMAIGCFANWLRNRSFHCGITGPLFLVAGVVFLASDLRVIYVDTRLVWSFVLIGTGIAFLTGMALCKEACVVAWTQEVGEVPFLNLHFVARPKLSRDVVAGAVLRHGISGGSWNGSWPIKKAHNRAKAKFTVDPKIWHWRQNHGRARTLIMRLFRRRREKYYIGPHRAKLPPSSLEEYSFS